MKAEGDGADAIGDAWREPDSVAFCNRSAGLEPLPPEGTRLMLGGPVVERDRGRESTKLSSSSSTSTSIPTTPSSCFGGSSVSETARSTSISSLSALETRTVASSSSRATAASGIVAGTKGEVTRFVIVCTGL